MSKHYRLTVAVATVAVGWYSAGCGTVATTSGGDGSERGVVDGRDGSDSPATDGMGAAPSGGDVAADACNGITCDGGLVCVDGACVEGSGTPEPIDDRLTIDLGDGVTMELVRVQAGMFLMGSDNGKPNEAPAHAVSIDLDYYIGKYEVSQTQWAAVMHTNPSGFSGSNRPVEQVSWDDAVAFCEALSAKTGSNIRLPSEAEWEYAARAGTATDYSFGTAAEMLVDFAWFRDTSGAQTHDVGQKQANPWGLYDVHGNVWEWCADLWHDDYTGAPANGAAWTTGDDVDGRAARGGSWRNFGSFLRSAYRSRFWSGSQLNYVGFRVASGT